MHATVCDYISDLVQNSIEAGASLIQLDVYTGADVIRIRISDNGKGMSSATLSRALDPFYSEAGKHDHRRVGLGLPLLYQTAEAVNGSVEIESTPGQGTVVSFTFDAAHIDTPPLGDLPSTVVGLMTFDADFDLEFRRETAADNYRVSRAELTETLGNLQESVNFKLVRDFLQSQENDLAQ
ncbi:MAG: ATP-binding protein [Kiritimatiellae bacterium]|nr:ATP-binding protein [Kiritimatiellia bacterium]